ncbi:MAG: hypothetical protein ACR2NO_05185 [Chloroflexota bacterium]
MKPRLPLDALTAFAVVTAFLVGAALARVTAPGPAAAQGVQIPRLVTAETFILQDRAGKSRVLITMLPDGRTGMALLDDQGRPRAGFGFEANGQPGLAFTDEQGKPRAAFGLRADGTPALTMFDADGVARIELGVGVDGTAQLNLGVPPPPATAE